MHILTDKSKNTFVCFNVCRAEFGKSDTVLLFHLTNHYSLIFAMREWVTTAPAVAAKAGNSKSSAASTQPAGVDALTSTENTPANASAVQHEAGIHLKTVTVRQLLCARRGQRPTAWWGNEAVRFGRRLICSPLSLSLSLSLLCLFSVSVSFLSLSLSAPF